MTGTGVVPAGIGTTENSVLGNYVGTDVTGAKALGNLGNGILIDNGANNNTVGADGSVNVIAPITSMASRSLASARPTTATSPRAMSLLATTSARTSPVRQPWGIRATVS